MHDMSKSGDISTHMNENCMFFYDMSLSVIVISVSSKMMMINIIIMKISYFNAQTAHEFPMG